MNLQVDICLKKEHANLIEELNENLSQISKRKVVKTSELTEALKCFSKAVHTVLNSTEIITTERE